MVKNYASESMPMKLTLIWIGEYLLRKNKRRIQEGLPFVSSSKKRERTYSMLDFWLEFDVNVIGPKHTQTSPISTASGSSKGSCRMFLHHYGSNSEGSEQKRAISHNLHKQSRM